MDGADCVAFLRRALPQLGLRWRGFRRVRGQVCKRLARRIRTLELAGPAAYERYLSEHPDEWAVLEALCTIPISRFYRDRAVFDALGERVLPEIARLADQRSPPVARCWSAGCASGEEPYTLSLLWDLRVRLRYPRVELAIVATDVSDHLLARAGAACYARSSLRELPPEWIDRAFDRRGELYCLRERGKACVELRREDMRLEQPPGPFDLILCRNAAFTYFSEPVQRAVLDRLADRLRSEGFLVIGALETLPSGPAFVQADAACVYRKAG